MTDFERPARIDENRLEYEFGRRWLFRQLEIADGWTLEGNRRVHHEWTAKHLASGRVLRRRYQFELLEAVRAQDPKLEAAVSVEARA